MCWDERYSDLRPRIGHFQRITMFFCRDSQLYMEYMQFQHLIEEIREVMLPDDLELCAKILVLDLSYASFRSIPQSWCRLRNPMRINLSYKKSLESMP